MDDEDYIDQLEAQIEEEEAEIKELKSWSTRNKFKDRPNPNVVNSNEYKPISRNTQYADYYYSTKYYSRQDTSPLGSKYDTSGIRQSK